MQRRSSSRCAAVAWHLLTGQASVSAGFAPLLLQIAASSDSQTDAAVKQAAAVYFKNLVGKRYDPYEDSKIVALDEQDKSSIRGIIVKAVTECAASVR